MAVVRGAVTWAELREAVAKVVAKEAAVMAAERVAVVTAGVQVARAGMAIVAAVAREPGWGAGAKAAVVAALGFASAAG